MKGIIMKIVENLQFMTASCVIVAAETIEEGVDTVKKNAEPIAYTAAASAVLIGVGAFVVRFVVMK
jgi:hypothetical protein